MERTIKNNHCRKALAFILMLSVLLGMFPLPGHKAYAAQQNSYHDPAEHWSAMLSSTIKIDTPHNTKPHLAF